ncbi:MAG TPA: M14 family zinc carboxypeptidase [Phycisphaerae bacterium]|nr:M14 family zinc carboxypeptidase [Phycisphaerae bacterium]
MGNIMKLVCRFVACAVLLFCASTALAGDGRDIFSAARLGDLQQLAALVAADPQLVNARTAAGETPLHYATLGRSRPAAEWLLEHGADVSAADWNGQAPLHVAATSNAPELIADLLAAGADATATDKRGETPLHSAARRFRAQAVAALLAAGADPNARNVDGQTPLHVLGSTARDADGVQDVINEIAAALIAAGADPASVDRAGLPAWPRTPGEPREPRQPSGYPTYDQIVSTLLTKQTQYPTMCQRYDIGPSSTTQHLYALKLTSNVSVEADKPEFKWVSTMHGNETSGVIMCLNMIDYLLTNYGTDPRVTNIVDNIEIWIVPCMNPYGYTYNTRYNANGYDLNRSFPEGSGSSPDPNTPVGRQPEVASIMTWSFGHSFTLAANLHEGTLVANYPFDNDGMGSVYSPTPDDDMFIYISEQYSQHNPPMWSGPFYHGITNGADWYAIDGGMQDWDYRYMGCNEVTIEINLTQSPPYSEMPTDWNNNRESMLAYMETCLIGVRGIVTGTGGTPVFASVTVAGRNHTIYSDPDVGDYHRMLLPGTYSLTFNSAGYDPVTVDNVVVNSGPATVLDVSFAPDTPRLRVTPTDGLTSTGPIAGPFNPASKLYTLQNPGISSIDYTVSKTAGWLSLSNSGGTLDAAGSTTLTVSINSTAGSLPEGVYTDTISFVNTTNHVGDTTRSVTLTVGGAAWDPVATGKTVNASAYVPTDIDLNATDPNGDPLTFEIESLPPTSQGLLFDAGNGQQITAVPYSLVNGGRVVRYIPPFGQTLSTSFSFAAWDATARSNIAVILVNVGSGTATRVLYFPMDTDPGWSTEAAWAFGHPTGSGSHNHDPSSGYTGTNVYGYNLTGDYTNNLTAKYLTTTAFNCTNLTAVELRFRRWLGVELHDRATVEVSNDGATWSTVWQNPTSQSDNTWLLMRYGISALADNHSSVYIRWGMGPTDASVTYPGWNIDDVELWAVVNFSCTGTLRGDMNHDGTINGQDMQRFVEVFINPYASGVTGPEFCSADMNADGFVTAADVAPFVDALLGL